MPGGIIRSGVGDAPSAGPSQTKGDGLTADLTQPLSRSDGDLEGWPPSPATRIQSNLSGAEEDTGHA